MRNIVKQSKNDPGHLHRMRVSLLSTIELMPDAIIIVNQDVKIVAANTQIYTVFGYTPEELLLQHLNLLIPARLHEKHNKHFKKYMDAPIKRRMGTGIDLFGCHKNGDEIDIDISLAPIKIDGQKMAMASIRDVSEVKELGRDLLRKNEELSLANTQLERLGYVIAHDLKSPLLNIEAIIDLLQRELADNENETIKKCAKDLNEIVASMTDLIKGITDYSKVGFQHGLQEDVNLNTIIKEVRKLVHIPPGFRFVADDNLPVIRGNKTKILQVFLNLVNNAMKYNDKPDGIVEIHSNTNTHTHIICIADNGPGVPVKMRNKIFELFQKGVQAKKGSHGIGLAVVKKIIEEHGGNIHVTSNHLGGASFVFSWPVK
ncbi:MAG: sensor histidine kinase, partial [Bacteroidia bacterium]